MLICLTLASGNPLHPSWVTWLVLEKNMATWQDRWSSRCNLMRIEFMNMGFFPQTWFRSLSGFFWPYVVLSCLIWASSDPFHSTWVTWVQLVLEIFYTQHQTCTSIEFQIPNSVGNDCLLNDIGDIFMREVKQKYNSVRNKQIHNITLRSKEWLKDRTGMVTKDQIGCRTKKASCGGGMSPEIYS